MNNKLFFFLFFLFGMLLSGNVMAQEVVERSTEKTKIGGKEYYLHRVKQGQTLYGLSKVYNVSIEELELLNPEVKDGLKVGHVLGIPVRPAVEPQKEEPQPVAVVPEPKPEPKPEPVKPETKEEPVVVKPEPETEPVVEQPVIHEPEPEPIVENETEPEPEPVVEEPVKTEPEPDPETVVELPKEVETPAAEAPQSNHRAFFDGKARIVQRGESLYDIAKEYGIDVAALKQANPRMTFEDPKEGTRIVIPQIANENDYIVHSCEYNERVSSLLKRWKVDENVFRNMNVSVGSHVFENQVVLIPIQQITDFYWMPQEEAQGEVDELVEETEEPQEVQEHEVLDFDFEMGEIPDCVADPANATKHYHVALMVPLYLYDIGGVDTSKDKVNKSKKSRPMSFLQFYEGFMIAAEAMERKGMKLDLTVIDVTDNVSSAENAVAKINNKDIDLIVGPFFGNAFEVVEEYAKANDIPVVNPMTTRKSVIEDSPNVIKAKAGDVGLILTLSNLVKNRYSDANVFIVSRENAADSAFLDQLEHHLNMAVNEEVRVSSDDFLEFARNESERQQMGSRLVPTIDVEGQVYSTGDFQSGATDEVVLTNTVKRYPYSQIGSVKSQLSGVRDNVIIAYGEDNVFATQMLNSLTKVAGRYPVTLVCVHDWQKHEKLLVDNLLKMNAIYISDCFVDYNSEDAKRFVLQFRQKYDIDPQQYAFEGYDVGCYFLNALMQYGNEDLITCLHCYQASMLHTNYRFYYKNYMNVAGNDGKENLYWSIYQYDKDNGELVPIDAFKKPEADD